MKGCLSGILSALLLFCCESIWAASASPAATPHAEVRTAKGIPVFISPSVLLETGIRENLCVLTFDDGPGLHTGELLDMLREHGIQATFFIVGTNAVSPQKRAILQRIIREGHEIGNHSMTHPALTKLSEAKQRAQIEGLQNIARNQGVQSTWLRPPYGLHNEKTRRIAQNLDLPIVLWTVDSEDWKHPPTFATMKTLRAGKKRGILLFHDIHEGTIRNMPAIIEALKADGAKFVSLSAFMDAAARRMYEEKGMPGSDRRQRPEVFPDFARPKMLFAPSLEKDA
ncbi:MAG: polysaccharide deacetylase family protein [Desulfovibrionaceae bacterium]|nr:polysaccharide deacetylase family protein [Desulfovibrionaceae bacterium]